MPCREPGEDIGERSAGLAPHHPSPATPGPSGAARRAVSRRAMIVCIGMGFLLPAAIMALAGCGSSTGPDDRGPIIPLRVGNFWVYDDRYFDSLGEVIATDDDTLRIRGTQVMDGETWYDTNQGYMMALRPDGIWNFYPHVSPMEISQSARYPAAVGDPFSRHVFSADGGPDSVEVYRLVSSVDHAVTIGARTYSCMVYTTRYRRLGTGEKYTDYDIFDDDFITFMAPNVGIVMMEWFTRTPSGQVFLRHRRQLITRP